MQSWLIAVNWCFDSADVEFFGSNITRTLHARSAWSRGAFLQSYSYTNAQILLLNQLKSEPDITSCNLCYNSLHHIQLSKYFENTHVSLLHF